MTTEQIESIITELELHEEFFVWQMREATESMNNDTRLAGFYESNILESLDEDTEKVFALMEHTGEHYEDCLSDYESENYLVLTDDEADEATEEYYIAYVNDIVLTEIPAYYRQYFDIDACVSYYSQDGRGYALNRCNGDEYQETINGTDYFIYQQ